MDIEKLLIEIDKRIDARIREKVTRCLDTTYFGVISDLSPDSAGDIRPAVDIGFAVIRAVNLTDKSLSVGDSVVIKAHGDNLGNAWIDKLYRKGDA